MRRPQLMKGQLAAWVPLLLPLAVQGVPKGVSATTSARLRKSSGNLPHQHSQVPLVRQQRCKVGPLGAQLHHWRRQQPAGTTYHRQTMRCFMPTSAAGVAAALGMMGCPRALLPGHLGLQLLCGGRLSNINMPATATGTGTVVALA